MNKIWPSRYLLIGSVLISLVSCATGGNSIKSPKQQLQCLVDYKVSYSQNDVPDWYQPPEGFCAGKGEFAVPAAASVLPLTFKNDIKNGVIKHSDSWFYVIWNCYDGCNGENRILKKVAN